MIAKNRDVKTNLYQFFEVGKSREDVLNDLGQRRVLAADLDWHNPRNLKACYYAGDDVVQISLDAYSMFFGDNLLYSSSLFPSLPDMSSEVVGKALELLNAPAGAGGTVTSGGTESILLAVRSALHRAKTRGGVFSTPEMVLAYNAHPAFDKAANMMGIKTIRTPLLAHRADPDAMADAMTENTIMLVASAHAYPLGHIDPIAEISVLAESRDTWLHVDGCIGGFFLPFVEDLGYDVPNFDFRVPGVTSMSADLHKYGFTARGASLVLLRDELNSKYHQFNFCDWPTGEFNTPTLMGSRPAGAVASAWTVMNYLGRNGYRDRTEKTMASRGAMIKAVTAVEGVHLTGAHEGGMIGFHGDPDLDMFAVRDGLTARGWYTGIVMEPQGFQMLLNYRTGQIVEAFANDLAEVAEQVRKGTLTVTGADMSYGG